MSLTFQDALTAVMLVKLVQVWISVYTYSVPACIQVQHVNHMKKKQMSCTVKKHWKIRMFRVTKVGTNACINDKLHSTLNN